MKYLCLALVLNLAGCGCTAVGCIDDWLSLVVVDSEGEPVRYTATLTIDGVGEREVDCLEGCAVPPGWTLPDASNRDVHVRIERPGQGVVLEELTRVSFTQSRPNGPLCDPVCSSAALRVVVE